MSERVSHAPVGYHCPFCAFISAFESKVPNEGGLLQFSDVITESEHSIVFCSIKWWPKNPGHVLIVPKVHFENIYEMPDEYLSDVAVLSKAVALGMKHAFCCDGTSTRQHNEPAGYQDVWHYHQHVFPRWSDDNLYFEKGEFVSAVDRADFAKKLRDAVLSLANKRPPSP